MRQAGRVGGAANTAAYSATVHIPSRRQVFSRGGHDNLLLAATDPQHPLRQNDTLSLVYGKLVLGRAASEETRVRIYCTVQPQIIIRVKGRCHEMRMRMRMSRINPLLIEN